MLPFPPPRYGIADAEIIHLTTTKGTLSLSPKPRAGHNVALIAPSSDILNKKIKNLPSQFTYFYFPLPSRL